MVSNLQEYQGQVPSSKERQRIVNESGRDAVMFDLNTEAGKIRLWDLSDGTWTAPLEKDVAMNHYLKKMVYKCSACNKCSVDQNEVKRHISQVKTEYDKIVSTYNSELYKRQRSVEYPDWGTQLDYIYHNGVDKWKTDIVDPVKTKYPKPE